MGNMIMINKAIGLYPLCNTGGLVIYDIDYVDDRVLVGLNDGEAEWCSIQEGHRDGSEDYETGFYWGKLFVPLSDVMKFSG